MIVVDTSAFISLATANSLKPVLEEYNVHTTEKVLQELENTAEDNDVHGHAANNVLENQTQVTVHSVTGSKLTTSRIDQGEASCVLLCRELKADFLLTDDLRALPELQNLTTSRIAISPIMLKALVKRGCLTENKSKNRLETLAENRDWLESPIYRRAQDLFSK